MIEPIPLAGCIILDDAERVLLIHRSTSELTQWKLPGGKREDGIGRIGLSPNVELLARAIQNGKLRL